MRLPHKDPPVVFARKDQLEGCRAAVAQHTIDLGDEFPVALVIGILPQHAVENGSSHNVCVPGPPTEVGVGLVICVLEA